jgi:XRE family transcriptional regulator, regulator of sulfur utilization
VAPKGRQPSKRSVGQQIAQLREQRKLTQEALATMAKVHRVTLADVERGAAQPTLATLIRLAAALRVPITHLIGGR